MPQYPAQTVLLAWSFVACAVDVSSHASDRRVSSEADTDTGTVVDSSNYDDDKADSGDAGVDFEKEEKECGLDRWILADDVANARDIGGTLLRDGSTITCGLLFRGSRLSSLSRQGCDAFARLGIRTVIDLRTASEYDSAPEAECISEWATIVRAPLPTPYSVSAQDYLEDLYEADSITKAFDVMGDPDAYPIYINCVYGRDRTGVVVAVLLLALGATQDVILEEYQLTREAGLSSYPDSLQAVLDEIERIGGVERYLSDMGVARDVVDTLRSRLGGVPDYTP